MPLIRIDVVEGRRSLEELRPLADTVQQVVLDVSAAPPGDRHQVITDHEPGQLIYEDAGLGIERTDDLVVPVVGNNRADRSAGLGRAQFLDGDL